MLTSNPNIRKTNLHARMKVAHFGLFRRAARLVHRYAMTATYENWERRIQKMLSVLQITKSKAKELICNSIPEALRDLHTSKCKIPHNRPYDVCLWKPAERNKVPTSKQLRFVVSADTIIGNQALYFLLHICCLHQVSVKFKREKMYIILNVVVTTNLLKVAV